MRVRAKVVPGYGVASGKGNDKRYPLGTLKAQREHFRERGLDLSPFFMGTMNVDIVPLTYSLGTPRYYFEAIHWSEHIPPENFYFFDVVLFYEDVPYHGFVYMPDPATKVEHEQKRSVLELILPKIEGIIDGVSVELDIPDEQLTIH